MHLDAIGPELGPLYRELGRATLPLVLGGFRRRRAGTPVSVGLVPTMGALHDGHRALLRAARAEHDRVIMSLFVNPTQFGEAADFETYPRDVERDRAIAAESEGVDEVYMPTVEEMYPDGFQTTVTVGDLAARFEGAHRPGHFDGVATVVAKLFNRIRPDTAYFGEKDAQQLAVIRRMTADLDLGVEIRAVPTVREPDGLAISSPKRALSAPTNGAGQRRSTGRWWPAIRGSSTADLDYLAVVDPETFDESPSGRSAIVVVAARFGRHPADRYHSGRTLHEGLPAGTGEMKHNGEPIVMITAYDYATARIVDAVWSRHGAGRRLGREQRPGTRRRLDRRRHHGRAPDPHAVPLRRAVTVPRRWVTCRS